jgi:hypothetical protein
MSADPVLPGDSTPIAPVQTPIGWEGYPPEKEIANLKLLAEWIELKLVALEAWRKVTEEKPKIRIDMGAEVRNAFRVLAHLGIAHTFPFPARSQRMTLDEAEAHFLNLRNLCMGRPEEKIENPEPTPSSDPIMLALAFLASQPNLSIGTIAQRVGLSRQQLYDNSTFYEAAVRMDKIKPKKNGPDRKIRGSKDRDGDLEAYSDE